MIRLNPDQRIEYHRHLTVNPSYSIALPAKEAAFEILLVSAGCGMLSTSGKKVDINDGEVIYLDDGAHEVTCIGKIPVGIEIFGVVVKNEEGEWIS